MHGTPPRFFAKWPSWPLWGTADLENDRNVGTSSISLRRQYLVAPSRPLSERCFGEMRLAELSYGFSIAVWLSESTRSSTRVHALWQTVGQGLRLSREAGRIDGVLAHVVSSLAQDLPYTYPEETLLCVMPNKS
jgi:hypothetical protein